MRKSILFLSVIIFVVGLFPQDALSKKRVEPKEEAPVSTAPALEDKDIAQAVQNILKADGAFDLAGLKADVVDGVVTFSGAVNNLMAKERAVALAGGVRGVKSVIDGIQVQLEPSLDRRAFAGINEFIERCSVIDAGKIDVGFLKGKAYLSGTVDSHAKSDFVASLVSGVKGVAEVDNKMDAVDGKSASDSKIKEDISHRFQLDPRLRADLVEVDVSNGNVILKGAVASAAERFFAVDNSFVNGVNLVNADGLEVKWWIAEELKAKVKSAEMDDGKIEASVKAMLSFDPRTAGQPITVKSMSGKIFLGGKVDNFMTKMAAEEVSGNAIGAWKVINRMRVKPKAKVEDNDLAHLIKDVLSFDSVVDPGEYTIAVRGGTAHLHGDVKSEFVRDRAGMIASMIDGVEDVNNGLDVKGASQNKSDAKIKADAEDIMKWDALIDAERIQIDVQGSRATISGEVDNAFELKAVVADAFRAGADEVKSEMKIANIPEYDGETFKSFPR